MKNGIPIIILTLFITALLGLVVLKRFKRRSAHLTIGILQTASHPALDAARQGFMDTLPVLLKQKVDFVVRNAQGDITAAHTIAQQFHADPQIAGIFAIATPALQAIAAVETIKPIFIAAVTDPHALGLMSYQTNLCGSSDMINVPLLIEAITQILPQVKTVAILYNPAEANASLLVPYMKRELDKYSIGSVDVGIHNQADLPTAVASALTKADALLTPTDNTVASAISFIATQALKAKKPLIVSDNLLVQQGALMARGINYYQNGAEAARCAQLVLGSQRRPSELPITTAAGDTIVINRNTAQQLGIVIPTYANIIFSGE
jgi:putative ABC transport system substrate-binding protein